MLSIVCYSAQRGHVVLVTTLHIAPGTISLMSNVGRVGVGLVMDQHTWLCLGGRGSYF